MWQRKVLIDCTTFFVVFSGCLPAACLVHCPLFAAVDRPRSNGDAGTNVQFYSGVWSPGQSANSSADPKDQSSNSQTSGHKSAIESDKNQSAGPPPVPIWTPSGSPSLERKEFRPVRLDTGSLKKQSQVPGATMLGPLAEAVLASVYF